MDLNTIFFHGEKLNILELFIRTSILYFMLFTSTKLMGFRQPSIMTPYNFLMAAGISHIAAARMVNPTSRLVDAIAIIIVYTLINLLISYIYFKKPSFVSQKTNILVEKGKILKDNLRKSNLTIDNLFSILRSKDASTLQNVELLIAEPTGDFSVAMDTNHLPILKTDMGINTNYKKLSQILIYKGKVDEIVLERNDLNFEWIINELKSNNISDIKNVFLGIITPDNKLYINK